MLYNSDFPYFKKGLPSGLRRLSAYNAGILLRRKWQPTPVLLPGKSYGWRKAHEIVYNTYLQL